ncbi:MAG: hypothetical protein NC090_00845 [Anaeroplasma bactoclasticum]|nr:hypothetical protein [Anaeroplasma bactoclasticum]
MYFYYHQKQILQSYLKVLKIRIIVENKGRIIIDYIDVCVDTKNQVISKPHHYRYGESYEYIDELSHKAYCNSDIFIYHVYNNYYEYYNEHEHYASCYVEIWF